MLRIMLLYRVHNKNCTPDYIVLGPLEGHLKTYAEVKFCTPDFIVLGPLVTLILTRGPPENVCQSKVQHMALTF